jgi:hypothetical protein
MYIVTIFLKIQWIGIVGWTAFSIDLFYRMYASWNYYAMKELKISSATVYVYAAVGETGTTVNKIWKYQAKGRNIKKTWEDGNILLHHTAFCGHRCGLLRLCYQYNASLSQGLKSFQMA